MNFGEYSTGIPATVTIDEDGKISVAFDLSELLSDLESTEDESPLTSDHETLLTSWLEERNYSAVTE